MEGPPLGPGGEDITWPDQVAPGGRKASSTRKIKPQTSNLCGLRTRLKTVEILGNPIFSRGHTYLSGTWGENKVQRWAGCFQVGVFTREMVSTQRVEGIHRWTKECHPNKRKKLNDFFDALIVIVG